MAIPIFRPRARIMKTLGEELISSDSVAIIELVKNSYDADASDVLIKFTGPLDEGAGRIEVIDNGKGMTLDVVQRAWMEPATPSKVKEKESSRGRRVLGEKGIGRFAASRLAAMLELSSKQIDDVSEVYAIFDWTQFDDDEKYLDEVEVHIESAAPKVISKSGPVNLLPATSYEEGAEFSYGTVLSMSGLKRKWVDSSFEDIQRGLSRLVSPFEEMPGFRIKIVAPEGFEHYTTEIRPPEVIKYPHYTVEGDVFSDGTYSLKYEAIASAQEINNRGLFLIHPKAGWVMRDDLSMDEVTENYRPPACGGLKIKLRVWDRDELGNVQQKIGGTISSVRKDLDNFAGINIYRDGFRVMPYGEPNNDWLRLDLRRVQKPTYRVSNNQILGYISISADGNPELKDQSNREGMRESQAYSDLKEIMVCILSKLEDLRYKSRKGVDAKKESDGGTAQAGLFDAIDLSRLKDHLSKQLSEDAAMRGIVQDIEEDFSRRINSIKSVVSRYSGLATLGKLVDAVLHEGRQPLASISGQAGLGLEDLEDYGYGGKAKLESSYERFSTILAQSSSLSQIFKRIEPFGGRKAGRPPQLYLENIIEDAFKIFSGRLKDSSITFKVSETETLVRVDQYEMQQILVNLIDNSMYWLQFVPKENRRILVNVSRVSDGVEILFSDSGPGVPENDRESIFDAYYSTRKDGAGLGLSIVGEMVSNYYSGSLELMDNGALPGATFRIKLCKRV